ncbi:MAG: M28 family peptidase [Bacteroidota bacterium]
MKTYSILLLALLFSGALLAQNQIPVISNLKASFSFENNRLTVVYDVADAENDSLNVRLLLSEDEGVSFRNISSDAIGEIGFPVIAGNQKAIYWDAPQPIFVAMHRVKVAVDDRVSVDIQAIVDQVDSVRIKQDLTYFAQSRHRSNQLPFLQQIQDSLDNRFASLGLLHARQEEPYQNYQAVNLIGQQSGVEDEQQVYIVGAHYDGVPNTPGADDNASGTVGTLEVARVLSPYISEKSIRYLAFDLEEEGLLGSFAYVNNGGLPATDNVLGFLNLEMIGYYDNDPNTQSFPTGFNQLFPNAYNTVAADSFRGNFITNVANQASSNLMNAYESAANQYVSDLKVVSVAVPGNGQIAPDLRRSDHSVFWDAGIPALMITDGSEFRNPYYHSVNDTVGSLNMTFMSQVIQASVATLAENAGLIHGSAAVSEIQTQATAIESFGADCQLFDWIDPLAKELYIQTDCELSQSQVRLFDLQGREVLRAELASFGERQNFSLSDLSQGIYVLSLESSERVYRKKVLLP